MSTILHANAVRRLRKILRWSLDGFEIKKEEAIEGLRLLATPKRSEKVKTYRRAARAEKQSKRAARKEKSAALRAEVLQRPGWDCELGEHSWTATIHVHHLKAGSAKRATEALHNLIRSCRLDHDAWHLQGPEKFHAAVERWCKQHGYPMPSVYTRRAA